MCAIDVAVITALCFCPPTVSDSEMQSGRMPRSGLMPAAAAIILMMGACFGMTLSRSPTAFASITGHGLPIQVDDVDFGVLSQGGRDERIIELKNPTDRT